MLPRFVHHLTTTERDKLTQGNRLLTDLTVHHCHTCDCELCTACTLTDVQEEPACHVPYLLAMVDQN